VILSFIAKKKLKYYGLIIIGGLVILAFTMSFIKYYEDTSSEYDEEVKRLIRSELIALQVQYSFKKQVQEWKNILLRGNDPANYLKYHQQFIDEFERTQNYAQALIDQFDKTNKITELASDFQKTHRSILADYQQALLVYEQTGFDASAADKEVKGIDREPEELLSEISIYVQSDITYRLKTIESEVFAFKTTLALVFIALQGILCLGLIRLTKRLLSVNLHDKTTGLGNRELFVNSITDFHKNQHDFTVGILDIDEFKIINETCGNSGGDIYLKEIGNLVQNHLPKDAVICRISADVIGFIYLQSEAANNTLKQLKTAVSQYEFHYQDLTTSLTCCIAIYEVKEGDTVEHTSVLNGLYASLLEAKSLGRNRLVSYDEEDSFIVGRQKLMRMVSHVADSLNQKSIVLFRQAISPFDTASQSTYYEVLMRVKHNGEFHSPFPYLQAAEKFHLINKIDQYVLRETILYLNKHPEDKAHYSINLSGQTLSDESFPIYIRELFENSQFPLSHLGFEITETDIIRNFSIALNNINFLKSYGCKISLDDFGTGMSSFGYIAQLNIDTVKIDGTFIKNIANVDHNKAIVKSIVGLAQELSLSTVAEFVETEAEMKQLEALNIEYCQGYLIHKPELFYEPQG
jgi:diguanylate cyclase (GGDEF)-like protein